MAVDLSILIPTMPGRESLLSRLLWTLERQRRHWEVEDQIEVIVHTSPDKGVGTKCNEMLAVARGRMSVSIDDDDLVASDYLMWLDSTLRESEIDFIGYRILYTLNGRYQYEIEHDALNGLEGNRSGTSRRAVTLKCPVRTEIARQFPFSDSVGGDFAWCEAVLKSDLVKEAEYIDQALYYYDFWDRHTLGPNPETAAGVPARDVGMWPFEEGKFKWMG
jgi:hypothetical protein